VPLSEHEQHLLEQMEQAMYAEDPKFASAMRGRTPKARQRRRLLLGCVGVLVGLVLVVLGVARSLIPLAVVGFVLMLAGAAFAAAPERKAGPVGMVGRDGVAVPRRSRGGATRAPRSSRSGGTFMQRMEQRWERRRDQGWGR
jgi:DUF3040 family protein